MGVAKKSVSPVSHIDIEMTAQILTPKRLEINNQQDTPKDVQSHIANDVDNDDDDEKQEIKISYELLRRAGSRTVNTIYGRMYKTHPIKKTNHFAKVSSIWNAIKRLELTHMTLSEFEQYVNDNEWGYNKQIKKIVVL